jgi:hypothetical protein
MMQTKDITDIETKKARYKVLPLENSGYCQVSICFITCNSYLPSDPLYFYL